MCTGSTVKQRIRFLTLSGAAALLSENALLWHLSLYEYPLSSDWPARTRLSQHR